MEKLISIDELSKEIHQNAVNKGFWEENYNTAEKLMLIVSEISEAMWCTGLSLKNCFNHD